MKEKSIKIKKAESLLLEVIPEALSSLSDNRVNTLSITQVVCDNGLSTADVYFYDATMTAKEIKEVINQLRLASSKVENNIKVSTGWFKSPKLFFKYDDTVEEMNKMEKLFEMIKNGKH
jgi:ribosome-binding factor A